MAGAFGSRPVRFPWKTSCDTKWKEALMEEPAQEHVVALGEWLYFCGRCYTRTPNLGPARPCPSCGTVGDADPAQIGSANYKWPCPCGETVQAINPAYRCTACGRPGPAAAKPRQAASRRYQRRAE